MTRRYVGSGTDEYFGWWRKGLSSKYRQQLFFIPWDSLFVVDGWQNQEDSWEYDNKFEARPHQQKTYHNSNKFFVNQDSNHILLMEWNCQNCKKGAKKGYPCGTCQNRENNWACTTCHFCNPTGNNMKRCGGGTSPAYWWYTPKGYPCKCGNRENSWRCYNCDFNNPKGYPCKCENRENNWRCLNCDRDVTKGYPCKICQNRESNWQCLNENFWVTKGYPCPKCQNRENNWQCKNQNFWITKGYPCPKCQNRENNWHCNNCNWDTTTGYPCGKCKKQK